MSVDPRHDQLGLFAAADAPVVEPAPVPPSLAAVAAALPVGFRLGSSSWAFPGWAGQVWAKEYPERLLARHGLPAYAAHPLLGTVSIDRSYYAPLTAAQYAAYAAQVPESFRFVVKAPAELTAAQRPTAAGGGQNAGFLDSELAQRVLVAPAQAGLASRLGLALLQFPPLPASWLEDIAGFAARLEGFLASLPPAFPRAVELRNPEVLHPAVFAALGNTGTLYCYTVHPRAPSIDEQHALLPAELTARGPLVVRWNLRPGERYASAKARFAPFTHIQAEDRSNRPAIVSLCRRAVAAARPAYIIANNKAEGCAPATLFRLAEEIVAAR
ncbi:MAG: DUF72 domain-containing protein [Gammaproteobacteria bacterium]|nr:DUF72 domain-containing protein [Gammaproteobacteria bacterium]TVQ45081.1 MAG: DUF72 domain-containing protein [Gammaproteobacteria bacterium]